MKLLATMLPSAGSDPRGAIAERAHVELDALWQLYRDGFVREMYSPGRPGAVLIVEATTAEEATELLRRLPLVADGVMNLDVVELHPFVALQMLFSSNPSA